MLYLNDIANQDIILKYKEEIKNALDKANMIFIICKTNSNNNNISMAQIIDESAKNDINIIFGVIQNDSLTDEIIKELSNKLFR